MITGRPLSLVIISSRQITSEATDEPPGLSMRTIIALAPLSRASRICSMIVSEPSTAPFTGSKPLSPLTMVPTALTTAIRDRRAIPSASHVTRA